MDILLLLVLAAIPGGEPLLAYFRNILGFTCVLLLSGGALILAPGKLSAQDTFLISGLTDEMVQLLVDEMRENIHLLRLSDGSHVSAETEEELKHPIIPFNEAKKSSMSDLHRHTPNGVASIGRV